MTTHPTTQPMPPRDPFDAADWLIERHEWPRHLVARVVDPGPASLHWLEHFAEGVADLDANNDAWRLYECAYPEPSGYAATGAWEAWVDAGPKSSERASTLRVMSGGELRMCRLIATLHPTIRTTWQLSDLDFDARGAALTVDWVTVALHSLAWDTATARALTALQAVTR